MGLGACLLQNPSAPEPLLHPSCFLGLSQRNNPPSLLPPRSLPLPLSQITRLLSRSVTPENMEPSTLPTQVPLVHRLPHPSMSLKQSPISVLFQVTQTGETPGTPGSGLIKGSPPFHLPGSPNVSFPPLPPDPLFIKTVLQTRICHYRRLHP